MGTPITSPTKILLFGKSSLLRVRKGTIIGRFFFKFINMHIYAELTKSKKYGNQPTTHNMVSTICGEIIKIMQFFKTSKLGYALSKQMVVEDLLKSGFSPWVLSNMSTYNAIDNFNANA